MNKFIEWRVKEGLLFIATSVDKNKKEKAKLFKMKERIIMIINLPKCVNVPPLIPLEVTKSLLRNERTPNEYPLLNITLIVGATIHLISLLIC